MMDLFESLDEAKIIIDALHYYQALLIVDIPYLCEEDQKPLEVEVSIIQKIIDKIEQKYPGLYDGN